MNTTPDLFRRRALVAACAACCLGATVGLSGCREAPLDGPPPLRAGRDECAECGMLVADERCAAASIVETDGTRVHRLFDDVGCLLDWERDHPDEPVHRRFVRDYDTAAWLDAAGAQFMASDSIATPMGFGVVAFGDAARTEAARSRSDGTIFSWAQMPAARVRWLEERGRPTGG